MPPESSTPTAVPEVNKSTAGKIPPMFQDLLPVAALWFAVVVGVVFVALFFKEPVSSPSPASLGVDKNGVPIINLNKRQVVERVSDIKPLNEPEVHAVFRWVSEHQGEAAKLTAEQKSQIIKAINQ